MVSICKNILMNLFTNLIEDILSKFLKGWWQQVFILTGKLTSNQK